MAVRTTAEAVGLIIDVDSGISLTSFIEVANVVVTKHCVDGAFTVAELELVERWLAAHFHAIRDPRTTQERAGSVGESYQSRVDLGFDVTHYGQMAMRLDWSGALSKLNEQAKNGGKIIAGVTWLGTESTTTGE
jgi:hypothetical protein